MHVVLATAQLVQVEGSGPDRPIIGLLIVVGLVLCMSVIPGLIMARSRARAQQPTQPSTTQERQVMTLQAQHGPWSHPHTDVLAPMVRRSGRITDLYASDRAQREAAQDVSHWYGSGPAPTAPSLSEVWARHLSDSQEQS